MSQNLHCESPFSTSLNLYHLGILVNCSGFNAERLARMDCIQYPFHDADNNSDVEIWDGDDFLDTNDEECPDSPLASNTHVQERDLVNWMVIFLLRLQAKFYIPAAALQCLIKFFYVFLSVIGQSSSYVAHMASFFPKSLYELHKQYQLVSKFKKMVVCSKCYSVYDRSECVENIGSLSKSRTCVHRLHKNSPMCNKVLLKTIQLSSGKKLLRPFKIYCYRSLKSSLQKLFQDSTFVSQCDHWRSRTHDGIGDIYDGRIWKEFINFNGVPFLANSYSLALAMNIDWFQPYKLTEASVGAVYLTVMNLPYHLRFKREFLILLGIIPGPKEPKRDINSFLRPLVGELLDFWKGMPMHVYSETEVQNVRCALICVACDMPASRKTCGFLGHSAKFGCSRCKKEFPGGFGKKDYSGFDRVNWVPRTKNAHFSSITIINQSKNKTERDHLESQHGCRYSVLLDLPYFDPVRMTIIDPMHNLFLGTAKHLMKNIWMKQELVTTSDLQNMQETMDAMKTPSNVGRIPRKLETGFSGFTADQLKNWVNLYSIPCLHSVLPSANVENWRRFVLACRIVCQHSLTVEQIALADALLLAFCKGVEHLYGKPVITPNMHMHCHLREVLLDYGPVYSFWCFSYERYNGILGSQPNNNKVIEAQLMQRFLSDNLAYSLACPSHFHEEFDQLCMPLPRLTGSLLQTTMNHDHRIDHELPKCYTRQLVQSAERTLLIKIVAKLTDTQPAEIEVNTMVRQYASFLINGNRVSARKSHSRIAMFRWDKELFGERTLQHSAWVTASDADIICPANVERIWQVAYRCSTASEFCTMLLMQVSWHMQHPALSDLGKPAQIWCNNLYDPSGMHAFVPIHLYHSQCIHCVLLHGGEHVLVVVPLVNK